MRLNQLFENNKLNISELNLVVALKEKMISFEEYLEKFRYLNNNDENEVKRKIKMIEESCRD